MRAYYNENDPYAAQWLRNLIAAGFVAPGEVDDHSIKEVQADDLRGYTQCHFFAGIGGWSHALRLAEWPDDRPVWTGSCPCQALSSASRGRKVAEDLWPAWLPLIAASRPRVLFGEQVAQQGAWLDAVCDDLEPLGYEIGAAVLPAVSVGKDHARPRIYFASHTNHEGEPGRQINAEMAQLPRGDSHAGSVVPADGIPPRMAVYRAFGNAIVPEVAAAFISAYLDAAA